MLSIFGLIFILLRNVNKLLSKHLGLFDINLLYVFESLQLVLLEKIAHTIFDGDDPSQKHFDVQLDEDFFFEVLQHFHLLPIFFKLENFQKFVNRKHYVMEKIENCFSLFFTVVLFT